MPPIYYLNPPPNPFWDFVASLEDHPFFAHHQRPVPPTPPQQPPRANGDEEAAAAGTTSANKPSENAKGKQPEVTSAEDPPEVDPSSFRPERTGTFPFRGRGRFAKTFDNEKEPEKSEDKDNNNHSGHPGCHGRGWHGGPPPSPFFHGPPWARPRGSMPGEFPGIHGPAHHGPPHRGGPFGRGGRGGPPCGRDRRGPPHHHHNHHGHHHRESNSPPREGGGFDLAAFLNKLGDRIGIDLGGAIEGLGLDVDAFRSGRTNTDIDFQPRTDIFENANAYTFHLSLPGAKKSDVGVDWDGEHSTLRVAGVVHRPGVDEEMMKELSVDGRKRETGVFEKSIRLGTKKEPANIDVAGITAKMLDGVLVVRVPKLEKHFEKKEVLVDDSPGPLSERPEEAYMNEKDLLFDAEEDRDEDMYDLAPEPDHHHQTPPQQPEVEKPITETIKGKERKVEEDRERARSETVGFEHPNETVETLPVYEKDDSHTKGQASHEDEMSDWEKTGSDDEGEYVKINVD